MSMLLFIGRPWAVFDASNKEHRQWFADFQRDRTWGKCPVRFISDDASGDLLTMIQNRLIDYYTTTEFSTPKRVRK